MSMATVRRRAPSALAMLLLLASVPEAKAEPGFSGEDPVEEDAGGGSEASTSAPATNVVSTKPEIMHKPQNERAARLDTWLERSDLAALESARVCHEQLVANQAKYLAKQSSPPSLRSKSLALALPPEPPKSISSHVMELKRVLGKLKGIDVAPAKQDAAFETLDTAYDDLHDIDLEAASKAAQDEQASTKKALDEAEAASDAKSKKGTTRINDAKAKANTAAQTAEAITTFTRELVRVRAAVKEDLRTLDNYLAGQVVLKGFASDKLKNARNEQLEQVAGKYGCTREDHLCLTVDGTLLGTEEGFLDKQGDKKALEPGFLTRLEAKSPLTVFVFAYKGAGTQGPTTETTTITMGTIERTSQLTRDVPSTKQSRLSSCDELATTVGYQVVKTEILTVPHESTARHGVVEYERKAADGKELARARHRVRIDHGLYYVDAGLLVPFVPRGRRAIVGVSRNGAQYVGVEERLHVTGALALDIFPGGRRKDALSPFEDLRCDERLDQQGRKDCRRWGAGRVFAELFGLQVGVDLNANLTDQFYFGAVLEPLTGLTFSTGVAILELDDLPSGVVEGQLVTSSADLRARARHVPRWYGGFTLSYDLVRFVQNSRARFKDAK